ncbi:AI-2E family transporter [Patescibacteria group bacterium]|nr:AI-2E family transporter [Patescibacteria group bacterium]MBU2259646.1 AI-2E family transporter [Patescibacteria group bacterium]
MTPKKSQTAFTSLRIVGEKAQRIIERARKGTKAKKGKSIPLPSQTEHDAFVVHISIQSAVKAAFSILLIAIGVFAVYHLRDKLILLFLGVFVAAVIDPGVEKLQHFGMPRGIAVLVHYVVALLVIFFLLFSFIPIIAKQLQDISTFISTEVDVFLSNPQISVPLLSGELNHRLTMLTQTTLQSLSINEFSDALQQMGQTLSTAAQGSILFVAKLAGSVAKFLINLIIVLVLGFFIQLEKERILKWIVSFMPERYRTYLHSKSEAMHTKIGQWARGELLLMLSIAILTFIALIILGMPYALTLAVLAGFCEFIPAVGPLIAAIPAVMIALSDKGLVYALIVAGVYYIIQWCENNLLVPLIMRRAVGLSPVAILFAMMVGISFPNTIHPLVGVMLAIPITTILALFLEDWQKIHR